MATLMPLSRRSNSMVEPSQQAILHAYRSLYKASLYAVRYSKPSRTIVRNQLRTAFRNSASSSFDSDKIKNTLEFLNGAGGSAGLESRILKGLCEVEYWHAKSVRTGGKSTSGKHNKSEDTAMMLGPYNATINMLNETMGMCLPNARVS